MNYLAHILLSGSDKDVRIGNFIGDAIKGHDYQNFKPAILKGILLHRQIDSFTDIHEIVHKSKKRLNERYGHYSGVVIDILYDYFLSQHWSRFCHEDLDTFISNFYDDLSKKVMNLPDEIQLMTPNLIRNNWFEKYQTKSGIKRVFIGMEKRIIHDIPLHLAIHDLEDNYTDLENDFLLFFPQLIKHTQKVLEILNKQYDEN